MNGERQRERRKQRKKGETGEEREGFLIRPNFKNILCTTYTHKFESLHKMDNFLRKYKR